MSTAEKLRAIRDRITVPMSDAQRALLLNDLDVDAAVQWLREEGFGGHS